MNCITGMSPSSRACCIYVQLSCSVMLSLCLFPLCMRDSMQDGESVALYSNIHRVVYQYSDWLVYLGGDLELNVEAIVKIDFQVDTLQDLLEQICGIITGLL